LDDLTKALLAARGGDRPALADFIRVTQPEVWRLCANLVDHQEADDLTQEVYLRVHRALPRFRGDGSARTWLLVIARRACADGVQARQRRRRLHGALAAPEAVPDPASAVALEDLLAGLGFEQRSAFVLTQVLGISYAEAAAVCGCPVGTIRSRVARARAELVNRLEEAEQR